MIKFFKSRQTNGTTTASPLSNSMKLQLRSYFELLVGLVANSWTINEIAFLRAKQM